MVDSTTNLLMELKEYEHSSTWFKDHSLVFTDRAHLRSKHIIVMEEEITVFLRKVSRLYLQSLIDPVNVRMESNGLNGCF